MDKQTIKKEGTFKETGYYDYSICSQCKGAHCCAHFGCMYAPQDFEVLRNPESTLEEQLEVLTQLLKEGKISIDMCWLRDPNYGPLHYLTHKPDIDKIANGDGLLYLRARNKGRPIVDLQFFLKKQQHFPCINWDPEKGCMLSEEERPYGGRILKPVAIIDKETDVIIYRCEDITPEEHVEPWMDYQLLMYYLYLAIRDFNEE